MPAGDGTDAVPAGSAAGTGAGRAAASLSQITETTKARATRPAQQANPCRYPSVPPWPGLACSRIVAKTAIPSAPPNCLAAVLSPLALANMTGGADKAAEAETPIVVAPMPIPARKPAGSQKLAKAGWTGRPKVIQVAQAPNTTRPKSVANRGPPSFGASRPIPTATIAADTAPGLLASPACSSE